MESNALQGPRLVERGAMEAEARILVEPVEGGWRVSCGVIGEARTFASGGLAEAQARAAAGRLASSGRAALVEIRDRRNILVGRVRYEGDVHINC